MYVWVCVYASVFQCACPWVLHDFVYIQLVQVCRRAFFSTHTVCGYVHVSVCSSWMFNVANAFCAYMHFRATLQLEAVMTGRLGEEFIMAVPSLRDDLWWSPLLVSMGGWLEWTEGLFILWCCRTEVFVALLKPSWASLCLQITSVSVNHAHALHYLNISLILQRLLWCNKLTLLLNCCAQ